YLAGDHVELRHRLGLLDRPVEEEHELHRSSLEAMLSLVRSRGLLPEGGEATPEQTIEALYRLLAQSPSVLLGVSLVDAAGERRVQNQPGTSEEHPNWQVPLADGHGKAVLLDKLARNGRFNALLDAVEEALRG
ncbi:4-alpha-glucanotransferase, partial [Arthrobacter deserti]|nr:4-alpha-glucanotransferase [Arthrobacter deserti]